MEIAELISRLLKWLSIIHSHFAIDNTTIFSSSDLFINWDVFHTHREKFRFHPTISRDLPHNSTLNSRFFRLSGNCRFQFFRPFSIYFTWMFALIGLASCYLVNVHEEKSFVAWMRTNKLLFTGDEYQFRFGLFVANSWIISEHNHAQKGFRLGLNKFAALTQAEYKVLLGHRASSLVGKKSRKIKADPPAAFDWRDNNPPIINAIKDQGQCGSCWAFSVVQAQESQWALIKGTLYSLSEQNIIDCVDTCLGCYGGL